MDYRKESPLSLSYLPWAGYLLALIATAIISAFLFILRDIVPSSIIALMYLIPVGLSSALWGMGPGITAAIASFLGFNYFFVQPYYSLMVRHTQDLLALLAFLGVSVFISQMFAFSRRSLAEATAREHETASLYELSSLLAGLQQEEDIARVLASQALDAFHAERAEVSIESDLREDTRVSLSHQTSPQTPSQAAAMPNQLVAPLQTSRGLLGEIQIWRREASFFQADERLLRMFANQGVLAVERAHLIQTEQRARVLAESDRMKSTLLSLVSHELRSPLSAIKAAVTSLRSEAVAWDTEGREDLLAMVEEETDHLNLLVGNLLNMSRIEAGALKPDKSWNELVELVSDVINRMHQSLLHYRLEVEIPDEMPLVPVDYFQMEQVFTNLLSNSTRYAPEGTVISIKARQFDPTNLIVSIKNEGPPVPPDDLEHIFEKFFRIKTLKHQSSTGLGLSICKGIVEAHGGRIWAENLPDGFQINFTILLTWEAEQEKTAPMGTGS